MAYKNQFLKLHIDRLAIIMDYALNSLRHIEKHLYQINLSLKSAKQGSLELAFKCLREEISGEFRRHEFILKSDILNKHV